MKPNLNSHAFLLVIVLALTGSAISANAQKVRVASSPAVDLTKYKTYSWSIGSTGVNALIQERIIAAVDSQLAAKGLKKVTAEPELTVSAWAWSETGLHVVNPSWAPALNSIQTGVVVGSQSWPVSTGTLVVDLLDAKTKEGVWRATASDTLKQGPSGDKVKDAKSVEKTVKKAVEKMFKQYPGQAKQ